GRGELTQVEERRPRGADDNPSGPGLEFRQGSFADVAGEAHVVAIDLRQPRRRVAGQGEQRGRAAVLLERDRECRQPAVRRLGSDLEGASLPDDPVRLTDGDPRRRPASGRHVDCAGDEADRDHNRQNGAQHGSHDTSLVRSNVPAAGRYRLTVRTDGSQPSNRGSIPRTATRRVSLLIENLDVELHRGGLRAEADPRRARLKAGGGLEPALAPLQFPGDGNWQAERRAPFVVPRLNTEVRVQRPLWFFF